MRKNSTSLGALRRALAAAKNTGARTEPWDLNESRLPMYEPGRALDEYGPEVRRFVEAVRGADALVFSTGAYHGTLAGVTKNALDFTQFLARGEKPYLDGKVVGLISTAGGDQAAANANAAMVHVVHALRGIVAPLMVGIPQSWQRSEGGVITDKSYNQRLDGLGRLVVDLAGKLKSQEEAAGEKQNVGAAA